MAKATAVAFRDRLLRRPFTSNSMPTLHDLPVLSCFPTRPEAGVVFEYATGMGVRAPALPSTPARVIVRHRGRAGRHLPTPKRGPPPRRGNEKVASFKRLETVPVRPPVDEKRKITDPTSQELDPRCLP